ncbi:hypothetical protein L2E82_01223 [Cichorium intybus]|uniref:Uncharacterized protein n=1 Tax=Cichorium intybus TaxID=13427 RepID=A0ACB9GZD6_CICIN|nr:hypothetical protein L2E82_01223 [Cichorium intybus]
MTMSICKIEFEDEQVTRKRKSKEVDQFVFLPDDMLLDILKRLPRGFLCIIRSWCNELILISNYKDTKQSLYVYNLFTEEGSYLPECNVSCGGFCTIKCGVAISFDGFKGIYKVVHLFMGPPTECHILILREDIVSSKWKKIQVPFMDGGRLHSSVPVSVEGRYFHWEFPCDTLLVSIDMVKEEIVNMSLPLRGIIFEMGGSLALFAGDTAQKAEIWILKDFKRKKWEKLQSVTLEKWYYRRFPVCGLMSNRYIILECKYSNARIEDLGGHAGELHNIVVPILIVASSPEKMTGLPNMAVLDGKGRRLHRRFKGEWGWGWEEGSSKFRKL